jgi:hypothetical protein
VILDITEDGLKIRLEGVAEQVYIRHVLGLRKNGDSVPLVAFVAEFKKGRTFIIDLTAKRRRRRKTEQARASG